MANLYDLVMGDEYASPDVSNGATMQAYEPTWRDKLAALIMGDSKASPEKRRVVEGLLGSSGLGQTGASVVDFTPFAPLLAKSDMDKAGMEGDTLGGLSAAMSMVPGAKPAAQMAAKAAESVAPKGIRAYHGSPHDFDAFDLSKIGTGEGAQAYGHGLYFAESEPVAKSYRDQLSKFTADGKPLSDDLSIALGAYGGKVDDLLAYRRDQLQRWVDSGVKDAKGIIPSLQKDIRELERLRNKNVAPEGRMYEVNIKADPEHFLDWDKPLSEQNQNAKGYLDKELKRYLGPAYDGQIDNFRDLPAGELLSQTKGRMVTAPAASNEMKRAGIPGVKYLDAGSRAAPDTNEIRGSLSMWNKALQKTPNDDYVKQQVAHYTQKLAETEGSLSRNYVVFDPAMIEILRKYGLLGLLGGGASASALNQVNVEQ